MGRRERAELLVKLREPELNPKLIRNTARNILGLGLFHHLDAGLKVGEERTRYHHGLKVLEHHMVGRRGIDIIRAEALSQDGAIAASATIYPSDKSRLDYALMIPDRGKLVVVRLTDFDHAGGIEIDFGGGQIKPFSRLTPIEVSATADLVRQFPLSLTALWQSSST